MPNKNNYLQKHSIDVNRKCCNGYALVFDFFYYENKIDIK